MPSSITYSFSPNTKIKSSEVNQNFLDSVSPNEKVRVSRASTQNIGTSSSTALSFLTADFEVGDSGQWDISDPTKIVCKKAGKYIISGFSSFAANATGYRQFALKVNGTTDSQSSIMAVTSGDETSQTLSIVKELAVNDYVQMFVFQNSGGNLNIQAGFHLEISLIQ